MQLMEPAFNWPCFNLITVDFSKGLFVFSLTKSSVKWCSICLFQRLLKFTISGCFGIALAAVEGIDIFHFARCNIGWCILSYWAFDRHDIINLYSKAGMSTALFIYTIWLSNIFLCLSKPVILFTSFFALSMSDFCWFLTEIQTPRKRVDFL